MTIRLIALLCCSVLGACSLFGEDDARIEVRTDATEYAPTPQTIITLNVSNKSKDPIFFICTGQIYLEELDGDSVVKQWMIHGFEECLSPAPIDTDQKEVFELGFDEKSALGNLPDAAFDRNVRYRLSVDLFWDRTFNRPLSDAQRRSNRFEIVRSGALERAGLAPMNH